MAKIFNQVDQSMTVLFNGKAYSVDNNHPNHKQLLEAFNENRMEDFVELTDVNAGVKQYVETVNGKETGFQVMEDKIFYKGNELHNTLIDRILGMKKEGHSIEYMLTFLENLLQNPSHRAVNELYDFLANKSLPITDDGCFLSYKAVRSDFTAKHTGNNLTLLQGKVVNGSIYNGVGEVVECLRNEVDDERGNECSKGLHVGGLKYSGPQGWYRSSGDKVVIVKVNPKDVVSVPQDHDAQKVRVCKYEVVEEYKFELNDYSTQQVDNYNSYDEFYSSYDEDDFEDDEIDVYDLSPGDFIDFFYHGEKRFCKVNKVNDGYITCILLSDDPSFQECEVSYRNFNCDEMECIEMC